LFSIFVHDDAVGDLESLWKTQPEVAARITAVLEAIDGDQDLLDRLTQHGYGPRKYSDFHVSKWFEQWNKDRDLWRLKIWDLEGKGLMYRIIYAFIPRTKNYHVLAIAPRNFNYDKNHPISRRIISSYEKL